MSTSSVFTGAPFRAAAMPPTTTNLIPAPASAPSAATKSGSGIESPNFQDCNSLPLYERQPFCRSQRKHPPDQRQIHPILAVFRLRQIVLRHVLSPPHYLSARLSRW